MEMKGKQRVLCSPSVRLDIIYEARISMLKDTMAMMNTICWGLMR